MKCDELKKIDVYTAMGFGSMLYDSDEVDAAIAELKQKLHDAEMAKDDAEAANTEYRLENEKLKAQNERLLKENSCKFYKDCLRVRNYEQELRATRKALWLARAERAKEFRYKIGFAISSMNTKYDYSDADKWQKVERLCRAKAKQYKEEK